MLNHGKWHYRIVLFPIFLLILVFILWGNLMQIGEFVIGVGKIVPSTEVKKIQHLEGGMISEILVKRGDLVEKGQVLYRIRNETAIGQLGELQVEFYAKTAEEARLRAELNGVKQIQFPADVLDKAPEIVDSQRKLFLQEVRSIKNNLEVLNQQLLRSKANFNDAKTQLKNYELQYRYSSDQVSILTELVKTGAASRKELLNSQMQLQENKTKVDAAKNQIIISQKEIAESNARIAQAKASDRVRIQSELTQVLVDIQKLKESISSAIDRVLRTDITSPVHGIVKALSVNTVGGIIGQGQVIAEVIPVDDKLVIEGQIRPQDRARIWPGQQVNISITAYDTSIHGKMRGTIVDVSADTFVDQATQSSFYLIRIEAQKEGFGIDKPLYPGMTAQLNVIAGTRTMMVYLFKPILKVLNSAFIEP